MSLIISFFTAFIGIIYAVVSIGKSNTRIANEKYSQEEYKRQSERFEKLCRIGRDPYQEEEERLKHYYEIKDRPDYHAIVAAESRKKSEELQKSMEKHREEFREAIKEIPNCSYHLRAKEDHIADIVSLAKQGKVRGFLFDFPFGRELECIECLPLLKWLDAEFSKHHPEYYVVRRKGYNHRYEYCWNFQMYNFKDTERISEIPYEEMKLYYDD